MIDGLAAEELEYLAESLTHERFTPFGEVVAHRGAGPRWHLDRAFPLADPAARPAMWVNRVLQPAIRPPVVIDKVERHPHSFQTLIPLHAARFLVAVMPSRDDGSPDIAGLRAFITAPGQGVTYRPNVWHFGFTALEGPNEVVVMIGVTGREDDCIVHAIGENLSVRWEDPAAK